MSIEPLEPPIVVASFTLALIMNALVFLTLQLAKYFVLALSNADFPGIIPK